VLKAEAAAEVRWINKVDEISNGNFAIIFAIIPWQPEEIKRQRIKQFN